MLIATERERPDVAERREELKRAQPLLNPDGLVFIDETWAKTNTTRPRGRAQRGERLLANVSHGHWKTTTFLAALRSTGLTAPLVVDGAINGELFLGWVRHHLAPALTPGDIVVMDKLGAHKLAEVREAIETAGTRLFYLPPYSPDFNPIELVSSKFKWLLKSAAARTVETLWSVCSDVLDRFTESECRNCFRHRGYRYTEIKSAPVIETGSIGGGRSFWISGGWTTTTSGRMAASSGWPRQHSLPGLTIRRPGWFRRRLMVYLRSGLRPFLRHTTRTVPELSHEHWYKKLKGVNSHCSADACRSTICRPILSPQHRLTPRRRQQPWRGQQP